MIEQTITQLRQLRQLKLSGMANALVSQVEQPNTYEGLPFEQRLQCNYSEPLTVGNLGTAFPNRRS
jgi:hypothetical protein